MSTTSCDRSIPDFLTLATKHFLANEDEWRMSDGPSDWGYEVKRHRNARGWSQETLAAVAGVSGGYISQVESGVRGWKPSRDKVIRLAQALNGPLEHWLELTRLKEPSDSFPLAPRPSFAEFVNSDPRLTDDQKTMLRTLYAGFVPFESRKTPSSSRKGRRTST